MSATNKGSREHLKSEDTSRQNARDEAVARDPDIGGIETRISYDVHARGRQEKA